MKSYKVNEEGFYGEFGGAYVPEILYHTVETLKEAYLPIIESEDFKKEYHQLLKDYVGRPSPLYLARRMSEKYGFMMESTFPDEFAAIEDQLPKAAPETMQLIEDIVNQHVVWKEELDSRYPVLGSLGRAARSAGDRMGMPSLETYMRAELKTYSPATVTLVHRDTIQHRSQGQNDAMATLLAQVQQYGFSSLEEAEEHQEKLV